MNSGIYSIKCLINNKRYIGSAKNFSDRKTRNFGKLKNKKHNPLLQDDFNKYGEDNFLFEVLEKLKYDENLLTERENYWIEYYKTHTPTYGNNFGYNMQKAFRPSKSAREINSIKNSGENNPMYGKKFKMTEEQINSRKHGMKGKPHPNRIPKEHECYQIKIFLLSDEIKSWNKKYKILAEKYNISPTTIRAIKEGNHWSNNELLNGGYKDWIN